MKEEAELKCNSAWLNSGSYFFNQGCYVNLSILIVVDNRLLTVVCSGCAMSVGAYNAAQGDCKHCYILRSRSIEYCHHWRPRVGQHLLRDAWHWCFTYIAMVTAYRTWSQAYDRQETFDGTDFWKDYCRFYSCLVISCYF